TNQRTRLGVELARRRVLAGLAVERLALGGRVAVLDVALDQCTDERADVLGHAVFTLRVRLGRRHEAGVVATERRGGQREPRAEGDRDRGRKHHFELHLSPPSDWLCCARPY